MRVVPLARRASTFFDLAYIAVDRLDKLCLLFDRQDLTGYGRHVFHPLRLQILSTQAEQLFLVRLLGVDDAGKVPARHDANAVSDAENLGLSEETTITAVPFLAISIMSW